MATVPLSGTNIRLISNVPFTNAYKNTRWFDNRSSQTNYFLNKPIVHSESQMTFQRIEGRHYVKVNKSIDDLWGTNYLMFQNAKYNNKWFYAFVTQLEYKNQSLTHVHFQIDVLQTWKFDMNFRPSFVVREHRRLWNSDGSPVVNTIDEGLAYGDMYETVDMKHYLPKGNLMFLVIVMKEKAHWSDGSNEKKISPSRNGIPQPLSFYIHPMTRIGVVPSFKVGTSEPIHPTDIMTVLEGIFTSEDAVNNVVSVYVTDYIGYDVPDNNGNLTFDSANFEVADFSDNTSKNFSTIYLKNRTDYQKLEENMGNKYDGFEDVEESKLLMYPYCVTVLEDFKGNRIEVKNEYIEGSDLILSVMGSMGTSNKVSYGVLNYMTNKLGNTDKATMSLEHSLINADPNALPILNDMLSAFLQGNRNSIQIQKRQSLLNAVNTMTNSAISGVGAGLRANPTGVLASANGVMQGASQGILDIQAIEAKQKDIDNMPADMSNMGSNTYFDFGNNYRGVYIIKKQIRKEYRKILGDFFKMFGYKTNEVKVPNFRTRKAYNYVQTLNCNITGNFNNEDLQELKSVFDNGITLWHTDDIGNYNLDNGVR